MPICMAQQCWVGSTHGVYSAEVRCATSDTRPKKASYFPSQLEPRRRSEKALGRPCRGIIKALGCVIMKISNGRIMDWIFTAWSYQYRVNRK